MEGNIPSSISVKAWALYGQEAKRRKRLFEQRSARARCVQSARNCVDIAIEEMLRNDEEVGNLSSKMEVQSRVDLQKSVDHSTEVRDRLSFPEHMLERPQDFVENWLCAAKPKGIRCLLYSEKMSRCTSMLVSGVVLRTFSAKLPLGTILDCIYSPLSETFFVVDCLAWRGQQYEQGTDFEFRQFWLNSKLMEGVWSELPLVPLQMLSCDKEGIMNAYQEAQQSELHREGLIFFHKQSDYDKGLTPLILFWQDQFCCDRLAEMSRTGEQLVYLTPVQNSNLCDKINKVALCTFEGIPLKIMYNTAPLLRSQQSQSYVYAKCKINGVDITDKGQPLVHQLSVVDFESSNILEEDSWSQVLAYAKVLSGKVNVTDLFIVRE